MKFLSPKLSLFSMIFAIMSGLQGCRTKFPDLRDVPNYQKPILSLKDVNKELLILKKQKEALNQKISVEDFKE